MSKSKEVPYFVLPLTIGLFLAGTFLGAEIGKYRSSNSGSGYSIIPDKSDTDASDRIPYCWEYRAMFSVDKVCGKHVEPFGGGGSGCIPGDPPKGFVPITSTTDFGKYCKIVKSLGWADPKDIPDIMFMEGFK